MSLVKVGSCPKCGSPIYAPMAWQAITPPPNTRTCSCAQEARTSDSLRARIARGKLFGTALAILVAFCAPAFAQAPAPSPSPWQASLYAGTSSLIGTGERREYLVSRAELAGPLLGGTARLSVDIGGDQDGGSVASFADPRTFRSLDLRASISHRLGALDVTAFGASTFSIEGKKGAPVDPRAFDGVGLIGVPLASGGSVGLGGGHVGQVGGWAAVVHSVVPLGHGGVSTVADYALPIQAGPGGRRAWVMRLEAVVRVGSFDLGRVIGR